MLKANNILKSPSGMRSYLPTFATELKQIERKIFDIFNLWGYQAIMTPTIEYFEALSAGMGKTFDKKLYKFIDYEGNILVLRPEMTAPIARTLSTSLTDLKLPLRLSYNASVFRYDQPQAGRNREIYQLGVEFIGEKNYLADAEAVILAIESLKNTGLENFNIDIGHAGFLNGIIREIGLTTETEHEIKKCLIKKDLVAFNNYISKLELEEKELMNKIPLLRGSLDILKTAESLVGNKQSLEAINNLKKIYKYIADYGFAEYITFDLGLNRGFDYYTGVVFEGFTEELGYNICGGGRYDNLLEKYSGFNLPAIGFAIGIERVRLALKRQGSNLKRDKIDNLIIYRKGTESLAFNLAKKLREDGLATIINLVKKDILIKDLIEYKEEKINLKEIAGIEQIDFNKIFFFQDDQKLALIDLLKNKKAVFSLVDGWEDNLWEI